MISNEHYPFRGIDMLTNGLVYGYYYATPTFDKHIIKYDTIQWDVDPSTVGRYTFIQDKNKSPIYEGDIIKYKNHSGIEITGVVNWSVGCFCCKTIAPHNLVNNSPAIDVVLHESDGDVEVIGTMYDNPVLHSLIQSI